MVVLNSPCAVSDWPAERPMMGEEEGLQLLTNRLENRTILPRLPANKPNGRAVGLRESDL